MYDIYRSRYSYSTPDVHHPMFVAYLRLFSIEASVTTVTQEVMLRMQHILPYKTKLTMSAVPVSSCF